LRELAGVKMNAIDEMIPMLHPMFGGAALGIFVIGILAAGLSSHMPNMMVIPWLTRDLHGRPRTTRTRAMLVMLMLLTGVSSLGAVLESRPVFLLLLSQAGISIVMPLALLGMMWLSARPQLTGAPPLRRIEWLLASHGHTAIIRPL
jgi:manganese transport protein